MNALEISSVARNYGGVRALSDVSFSVGSGTIHSICGENGAGKSTLIKCLSGNITPDAGSVLVHGEALDFGSVAHSASHGIAVIHQESTVFPDMNTVQNLFVGREIRRGRWRLDHHAMATETRRWMAGFGQDFDIFRPVEDLSVADRQMVAMARALSQDCRVLILDEPTASMTPRESSRLLEILGDLRAEGVTILFISHRLHEVLSISDAITVLRDGRHVLTCPAADIDEPALIRAMVGRDVPVRVRKKPDTDPDPPTGTTGISRGQNPPPLLEVNALTLFGAFEDISLSVHAGEIVGLAGLVGSGRSEVARAVFGIDGYQSGSVRIEGEPLPVRRVRESIRSGLGMVPEDRQHEGLILALSIHRNLVLTAAEFHRAIGIVDSGWESGLVADAIRDLQIKASDPSAPVETLSGGNQQKVVLGRWMAMNPKILILDEPTRGVDVGAKAQVHELIRRMAGRGMGILVISSDLSEILALADRTIVMREGRISGSLARDHSSEESIMQLAFSAPAMEDRS